LNEDGALQVMTPDGIKTIMAGEVRKVLSAER
jgi:hypothetical protein